MGEIIKKIKSKIQRDYCIDSDLESDDEIISND